MNSIYNFINWCLKDEREFASGLDKYKLYWVFIVGSFLGVYYEQIENGFFALYYDGMFKWELRRGLIYEPLNPLYGLGALLFIYIFIKLKTNKFETFIYGGILGGILEYCISFLQETFTGTRSWDYADKLLNINGRTTIPYMIVWGLFALFLVYILYPYLSKILAKIPYNLGVFITRISLFILIIDCFLSFGAIIRLGLRHKGYKPFSFLGNYFDKYYPDEFIQKHYPNTRL